MKNLIFYAGKYHYAGCYFPTTDQAVCNCPDNLKPMNKPLRDQFPISTFVGETQEQLIKFVKLKIKEAYQKGKDDLIEDCPDTQFLINKAREELKVDLSEWAKDKIQDQGISNGYYNAMNDLLDKLK
jgi:hypothetical protein